MERDEEKILNNGLIQLNKQQSVFSSDGVFIHCFFFLFSMSEQYTFTECFEYLLLHAPIAELPSHDAQWQKSRAQELIRRTTTLDLYSPKSRSPLSLKGDHHDYGHLEDMNIPMTAIDSPVLTLSATELMDSPSAESELQDLPSIRTEASEKDKKLKRITTDRFRAIMAQSGQDMDINGLVDRLKEKGDDGQMIIPLEKLMTAQVTAFLYPTASEGVESDEEGPDLMDLVKIGLLMADEDEDEKEEDFEKQRSRSLLYHGD